MVARPRRGTPANDIAIAWGAGMTRPFSPETLAAKVFSRVRKGAADECWLWEGPSLRSGYGNAGSWFHKNVGTVLAHRLAYLATKGKLADPPPVVRHTCDTRLCCNPGHLIPGTPLDNMRDMVTRGRSTKGRQILGSGESHPCAKLTNQTVRLVFALQEQGFSHRQIGAKVGVSGAQIGRILRRESRASEAV